jgi:D-alanyl-D-alanine carboxypeptidase
VLAGEIITRVSGRPWREVVARRVFARAGPPRTDLPAEGDQRCKACARGDDYMDGLPRDPTAVDPSMAGAAGGSAPVTSSDDLVQFFRALMAGELFDRADTLDTMRTFVSANVPEELQIGYGLGLILDHLGEVSMMGQLGGTAGFHNFVFYLPNHGVVLSGFMNRRGDLGASLFPVLEAVSDMP